LQAATFIDDRDPADGPFAHPREDALDIVSFPRDDELAFHHVADREVGWYAIRTREHLNNQIAIGDDADRPGQRRRLIDHHDHVTDAVLSHAPSRLEHGLVLGGRDYIAYAELACSHAQIDLHRAFQL
jgi:hypothetical protein